MQQLSVVPGAIVQLRAEKGVPEQVHVFSKREIQAINTALAAGRPLLLRGEPGVGKSQLAHAAAKALGRAFVAKTVDASTEAHELLWHFDAVARLAQAQVQGALIGSKRSDDIASSIEDNLAISRFIYPQVLWWALNWTSAAKQANYANIEEPKQYAAHDAKNGVVALVDEIDKGDTHVPNGLLEALGAGSFKPFGFPDRIVSDDRSPLIIITTNEERRLPDAFVRRCFVLKMQLPAERDQLMAHLLERGRAHFPDAEEDLLDKAAKMLVDDRDSAKKSGLFPLPGQAEYFDLLRAVREMAATNPKKQLKLLDDLSEFALKKGGN